MPGWDFQNVAVGRTNPLSQEGDFPSYHFCVFARLAIRSIYPPFVQIPMYLWKKFQEFLPWKKLGGGAGGGGGGGGGGLQQPQPPVLRGKGWQQK